MQLLQTQLQCSRIWAPVVQWKESGGQNQFTFLSSYLHVPIFHLCLVAASFTSASIWTPFLSGYRPSLDGTRNSV